jgi:hypothetical protein
MFTLSYTLPAVEENIVTVAIVGIMEITSLFYLPARLAHRDLARLGLPARIHIITRAAAGEVHRDLIAVTERKRHGATIIPVKYMTVIRDLTQRLFPPPLLLQNTSLVS